MKLSEKAEKALERWIDPETWYKNHPAEDERFFGFVETLWEQEGSLIDETATREIIFAKVKTFHPDFPEEEAKERIRKRVRDAQLILDYLCNTQG